MRSLILAQKIIFLVLISLVAILVVGYVGLDRLGAVNSQIRYLVDNTIEKRSLLTEFETLFLASIRSQKNAILSTEDEPSKAYAKSSQDRLTKAKEALDKLKSLIVKASGDGQSLGVDSLATSFDQFIKINDNTLKLAVQNTNVKARRMLASEGSRPISILQSYLQKWLEEVISSGNPTATDLVRLKAIYICNASLANLYKEIYTHIESSSPEEMDEQDRKLAEIQTQIQNGLPVAAGTDPTRLIEPNVALTELKTQITKILQLSHLDTNNRSALMSLGEAKEVVDEVMGRITELDKGFREEAKTGRDLSESRYHSAFWWVLGSTLAGILLGVFFATLITRSITKPIQQISKRLLGSAGDLSNVSNQLISQSEVASSKATSVASASEELSNNIGTMASAAEQMSASVASISSASEEMSINVGTISSAAEQTSANVNVVSSAVDQISSSFGDILKEVREGTDVASEASRMADSATQTIQLLNRSGTEISKVTDTIKMIALQTNLLALNATIEATSAGEAGKGFAVVAHEIKELANQSAKAAEDIARKIEGVQNNTRQAVDVIQNVSQIIKDINASSGRISASVEKQTRAASMISQNVGEANKGVGDIARSIAEVAKAAGDMSRNVAEAARGATDVSRNVAEAAKAAGGISSDIHGVSEASGATNGSASRVGDSAQQLDQIGRELRGLVIRSTNHEDFSRNA